MAENFIIYPPDSTGKKARTVNETIAGNDVHTGFITFRQMPTYFIAAQGITPAVGRLITVLNRHATKVCRIWKANLYYTGTAVITGTLNVAALQRITHTATLAGGTSVTPIQADTADGALAAGIDVMTRTTTAITSVGEFKRFLYSSDEATVTTADMDAYMAQWFPRDIEAVFRCDFPLTKPFVLRPQATVFEGFNIEGIAGTLGALGFEILMTVSDE